MLFTLIALSLTASTTSHSVTVFVGPPEGVGDVQILDEAGILPPRSPAELQGIRLLPIDFVGRTELDLLATDRPRLRDDVPGASRLALQHGLGSLYRFRRDEPGGGAAFGWMRVDASGSAGGVWERMGTGSRSSTDPLLPRVSVSPDGRSVLFATTPDAGGDLYELDLATGIALNRTELLAPRAFSPAGLFLCETWGFGAGAEGVVRFDRLPGAQAHGVALSGATFFSGEAAVSASGLFAVTTAGFNVGRQHVYSFGASGPARRITTAPAAVSSAGYLPEHTFGPYLAVSDDGATCAWVTDTGTREAFVRADPPAQQPAAPVQVTSDALYLDTLDEIGVLFFAPALILAVGERGAPGPIEKVDLYRVDDPMAQTPAIANLTMSSGTSAPPFLTKSVIDPEAIVRVPGSPDLFVLDGRTEELLLVSTSSGTAQTVLTEIKEIQLLEGVADDLLLGLRRNNAGDTRDVVHLDVSGTAVPTVLASLGGPLTFGRPAVSPDGWVAFVISDGLLEWLARVELPTLDGSLVLGQGFQFGPALSLRPGGALDFTLDVPSLPDFFLHAPNGGPLSLVGEAAQGFVLPGA